MKDEEPWATGYLSVASKCYFINPYIRAKGLVSSVVWSLAILGMFGSFF